MRTNYDYLLSEGFVLNQSTGKLEEFIPTKVIFDFQTESIIYKGLCGGVENSFDEEDFKLYKDVNSFKQGVEISANKNETIHSIYWDRDAAIAMNDIVVVDRNGNEKVVPGIGKRMALNEEQSKALKTAEAALKAMKDLGMCIGYDNETDRLFTFNNIPDAEYSSYDEAEGYVQIDGYTTMFDTCIDTYCGCDGLWVKCKD